MKSQIQDRPKNRKPSPRRGQKKKPLTRRPNVKYPKPVYHTVGVLDNICPACGDEVSYPPYIESREELTPGVTVTQVVSDGEPCCPGCGWTERRGMPVQFENDIPEYGQMPF